MLCKLKGLSLVLCKKVSNVHCTLPFPPTPSFYCEINCVLSTIIWFTVEYILRCVCIILNS